MSGPIVVPDGDSLTKDPADVLVITFDWSTDHLGAGILINSSAFAVVAEKPAAATLITLDNAAVLPGLRSTQIRLTGGTAGARYRVENRIVTTDTPTQTVERSIRIKVENL